MIDKYGNEFNESFHKVKVNGDPAKNNKGQLIVVDDAAAQAFASQRTATKDFKQKAAEEMEAELEKQFGIDGLSNEELASKVVNSKPTKEQILQDRMQISDESLKDAATYDPTADKKVQEYEYDYDINSFDDLIRTALGRINPSFPDKIAINIDWDKMCWEFRVGSKVDCGTMKQPFNVIMRCARSICVTNMALINSDGTQLNGLR